MTARREATTLRRGQVVTIDGREYRDRTHGNSYCATRVFIDGREVGRTEIEYGYGDAYRQYALRLLADLGYVSDEESRYGGLAVSWSDLRQAGITVHATIAGNQTRRDVTAWGSGGSQ